MVTVQSGVFTEVVQTAGDGSWELIFPLQNGVNDLVALATDRAGQVSPPSDTRRVVVSVQPPLYGVGVEPDIAGLGITVTLEATARNVKPLEGAATRWITATVPSGDSEGLNLVSPPGPTGTWRTTWPVPGDGSADGERVGPLPG